MSDKKKQKMADGSAKSSSSPDSDIDLDGLLNSALKDFVKSLPAASSAANVSEIAAEDVASGMGDTALMDSKWTEEFIKQAAQLQNMQSFMSAQTPANPLSAEDVASMSGGLNMGESGENDLPPFMQNMLQDLMQNVLPKEIIYPALKDIVDRYPTWLAEVASTLSADDLERFTKQKDLMAEMCKKLESESPKDSTESTDIIELVLKLLKDCGQPPSGLVGEVGWSRVDPQGIPSFLLNAGADTSSPRFQKMMLGYQILDLFWYILKLVEDLVVNIVED